jgi:acyl carrier protein
MTSEEINSKLTSLFRNIFKNEQLTITRELTAEEVEGWDSITHLLLITEVEKVFSVEINGFDVMGLHNVGDLLDLVERKLTGE